MSNQDLGYQSPSYYELSTPPELDWRIYRPRSWYQYREEWDSRCQKKEAKSFPLHLDIDPTNACNLKCPMCPRTYYLDRGQTAWNPQGKIGFMELDFYKDLIRQAKEGGAQSVKLNFLGEPLLHPKLPDMVEIAAQAGLWVMINTNGVLLTKEMSARLLEAGLTDIFFSFDSPYPEIYEKVRVGASFEQVLSNIKDFINLKDELKKNHVQTRASMVLDSEMNGPLLEKTQADYVKLFRDLKVAEIGFGRPTIMGFDYEKNCAQKTGFTCPDIYRRLFIFWDGATSPCCGEWERKLNAGSAQELSLTDLWHSPLYKELRAAHHKGEYFKIEACRACSVPYLADN